MRDRLAEVKAQVQAALDEVMAGLPEGELTDAMRYACTGGKRIRAFLVMESARLFGLPDAASLPVAAAVEALHAYSLVHDDLPSMDDDDLRRGLPTVHVQWSEATAILAGDALQSLAFGLLTEPLVGPPEARLALVCGLSDAAGGRGMVWGQALDIAAETAAEPLDLAAITRLQQAKTGALIQFAATAGAVMAGEDPGPLAEYARNLGLAFQIQDDILDVTGTEAETGKRTGKDGAANKATFVSLLGLEGARDKARALVRDAEAALDAYGEGAGNLRQLARFVIERDA
ncbi:polyprenyl synthetase family protein [Paracoccus sp. P2]|uniref:Geranylgeranyl diphosphate synthase n=1 Tax=Paracoccus pantotrophus TaxID=82367 RepID=A0A1I5HW53_PARPN|nr:farnesyl diphosphate synthase [Paracoccus pantotrophus]MDF3854835.1 polyprenyl synthetase family protein [Paracoccus pantotrophus]QFG38282.1 polyprenyl synthetase family protein [Paracoccus pantotrophus]QLH15824.1 polyprenyl synthetase family protein [Paracoccus pantotrophus]RDD96642.1 polyprenyl synthetase family protein [Paracoccus pantotrophus]RKS51204.1 farnesyl-diphosphate synthase [Paracoccus pantotrophus]